MSTEKYMLQSIGVNHRGEKRENNDFYATEPLATKLLLDKECFNKHILEPSCGKGHMSEVLIEAGYKVTSSDLIDRGYGEIRDFFDIEQWNGDIITNPPYKYAEQFLEHGLNIIKSGSRIALFLKIQFLEGRKRHMLFKTHPPKFVYVSSKRLICAKGGDFDKYPSSVQCYAWYIWEKDFKGETILRWLDVDSGEL